MMSCKEAARLTSERRDRSLSLIERISLSGHYALCKMCRVYKAQLEMIGKLSRLASSAMMAHSPSRTLPTESKNRIKRMLAKSE